MRDLNAVNIAMIQMHIYKGLSNKERNEVM